MIYFERREKSVNILDPKATQYRIQNHKLTLFHKFKKYKTVQDCDWQGLKIYGYMKKTRIKDHLNAKLSKLGVKVPLQSEIPKLSLGASECQT